MCFLPALLFHLTQLFAFDPGQGHSQPERPFLYRESPAGNGQQAVRVGNWKAIRPNVNALATRSEGKAGTAGLELYDLAKGPKEEHDVAAQHPDIVAKLAEIIDQQHVKSDVLPFRGIDGDVPALAPKKKGAKKA